MITLEQLMQIKKLKRVIRDYKKDFTEYEMITMHDLLHFISHNKKALTSNQKLVKIFKKYNVRMKQHETDDNIYILHEGVC